MPPVMRALAQATPHAWALAGYQDVLVRGLGLGAVLPELGVLLGFAAVFFAAALLRFRFE
jgi:linearmycin/streptolysin S transport system permease protein